MTPPETWPLPSGLGGVFGDMVLKIPALFTGGYPTGLVRRRAGDAASGAGAAAVRLRFRPACPQERLCRRAPRRCRKQKVEEELRFDDEEDDDEGILALGAITHWWLSARAFVRRTDRRNTASRDEFEIDERRPRQRLAPRRRAGRVGRAGRSHGQRRRPRPRRAGILRRDGVRPIGSVDPVDFDDDFGIE